jgi:hypothetical protein
LPKKYASSIKVSDEKLKDLKALLLYVPMDNVPAQQNLNPELINMKENPEEDSVMDYTLQLAETMYDHKGNMEQ